MTTNRDIIFIFIFSILIHIAIIFFVIPKNFKISNEKFSKTIEIDLQNFSQNDNIPLPPDINQENFKDFQKVQNKFNIPRLKTEKINYEKVIKDKITPTIKNDYSDYLKDANTSVNVPFAFPHKIIKPSKVRYKKGDTISNYLTKIKMIIESNKIYPKRAVVGNIEGKVFLKFSLYKNGIAKDIKVIKSSGYKILDNAAIEAIKRSLPFPKFPEDLNKNKIVLSLQLIFKLRK